MRFIQYMPTALLLLFVTLAVPFFQGTAKAQPLAGALPVIVSIAPQKYLVESIGKDHVSVSVLVKPGADPHSYEPGPAQMRLCAEAKLYFTIGVPFEKVWLPRIQSTATFSVASMIKGLQRLPAAQKSGFATIAGSEDKSVSSAPANSQLEDPHVWLSPVFLISMLPNITQSLSKALPEYAHEFEANAKALESELLSVHNDIIAMFQPVPQEKRIFISYHPSFAYFSKEYALKEICVEIEGKEPGAQDIKAALDLARSYHLHTVFTEPQLPKTPVQAFAANFGATVQEIDTLQENLPKSLRGIAHLLVQSFTP